MNIIEEKICNYIHSVNGADPMWCFGSTVIARMGDTLFCTVPQAGFGVLPLSDRHIELYRKHGKDPWELVWCDTRFTREPAPLVRKDERTLLMTANPSLRNFAEGEGEKNGMAETLLYTFDIASGNFSPKITQLTWDDRDYFFMDHSYRGSAIDCDNGDVFFTQQYVKEDEGAHCYAIYNQKGEQMKADKLEFPVRSCYHNLAIRNGAAYVLAISDIREPVKSWADYKYEKTGVYWDYDFRNLYFKYTDDAYHHNFSEVITIDSREDTCGAIRNLDIHAEASGVCHILYSTNRVWHGFMRDRFFPEVSFDKSLEYRAVQNGRIIAEVTLDKEIELPDKENPSTHYYAAFHENSDHKLVILINKLHSNGTGKLSDGWHLMDLDGGTQKLDINAVPSIFHTARPRCGNLPSDVIDVFVREEEKIFYIGIEL